MLLEERHLTRHARQVAHQPCPGWQRQGVSLSASLDVLQTRTVDKVLISLLWLDAQHRPSRQCLGIHKHHLLGIRPHLDRDPRRLPLVLDKLARLV